MTRVALTDYEPDPGAKAIRVGYPVAVVVFDSTGRDATSALFADGTLVYEGSDGVGGGRDALDGAFSTFKGWTSVALVALDL